MHIVKKFLFASAAIILWTTNLHADTQKKAGYFFAYNDTDRIVVLTVGNYFPISYTIDPHSNRMVWVTTDNQNIHIKEVFP